VQRAIPDARCPDFNSKCGIAGATFVHAGSARRGGGGATVRIRDSKGGEGPVSFPAVLGHHGRRLLFRWRRRRKPGRAFGGGGRFTAERAIEVCQDEVRNRSPTTTVSTAVDIRRARADDGPGRNDYIVGEAIGRRGGSSGELPLSAGVEFQFGTGTFRGRESSVKGFWPRIRTDRPRIWKISVNPCASVARIEALHAPELLSVC